VGARVVLVLLELAIVVASSGPFGAPPEGLKAIRTRKRINIRQLIRHASTYTARSSDATVPSPDPAYLPTYYKLFLMFFLYSLFLMFLLTFIHRYFPMFLLYINTVSPIFMLSGVFLMFRLYIVFQYFWYIAFFSLSYSVFFNISVI
jgi:hypothetical protein